jgi:hypothetical protein
MKKVGSRRQHEIGRTGRIIVLVILAMGSPAYALGQAVPSQGDRVRISRVDGTVETGIFQSASAQGVQLRPVLGSTRPAISLEEIELMERDLGRHSRFWRNFGITVGASIVGIAMLAATTWEPCVSTQPFGCLLAPQSRSEAVGMGALAGLVIGLPIGTLVGSAVKYERWEPLSLSGSGQAAFSIQPIVGRRFGLSASLALGGH